MGLATGVSVLHFACAGGSRELCGWFLDPFMSRKPSQCHASIVHSLWTCLLQAWWSPVHPTSWCIVQQGRRKGESSRAARAEITALPPFPRAHHPPLLLASLLYYCWVKYSLCWLYQVTLYWCTREFFFFFFWNYKESFAKSAVKSLKPMYLRMNELNKVLGKFFCTERSYGFAPSYQQSLEA